MEECKHDHYEMCKRGQICPRMTDAQVQQADAYAAGNRKIVADTGE
jgi:hypothetical protein